MINFGDFFPANQVIMVRWGKVVFNITLRRFCLKGGGSCSKGQRKKAVTRFCFERVSICTTSLFSLHPCFLWTRKGALGARRRFFSPMSLIHFISSEEGGGAG